MMFNEPLPFTEAVKALVEKQIMPTDLTTAQLRGIDASARRQAMFSAQTTNEYLLQLYKDRIGGILNPVNTGPGSTTQFNPAYVRQSVKNFLAETGYAPSPDNEGTLQDLGSDGRINLVLKTNTELAQGAGHLIQQNDPAVLDAFPALELVRFEDRKVPRDWEGRWRVAARAANDPDAARVLEFSGRMVALKDSPIWDSLGDSGLFPDGLDNPYPPFAFNSGMWTQDVAWDDAKDLGLVDDDTTVKPREIDFADLFNTKEWMRAA